jgi:hypothetical protein
MYTSETGLCAMIYVCIYISCFIKIGSGIEKLIRGIHRHTDIQTA